MKFLARQPSEEMGEQISNPPPAEARGPGTYGVMNKEAGHSKA